MYEPLETDNKTKPCEARAEQTSKGWKHRIPHGGIRRRNRRSCIPSNCGGVAGMKCMHTECNRDADVRGLCFTHYNYLRNKIRRGKITEKKAVKQGMILAPKRTGRPEKVDPFFGV